MESKWRTLATAFLLLILLVFITNFVGCKKSSRSSKGKTNTSTSTSSGTGTGTETNTGTNTNSNTGTNTGTTSGTGTATSTNGASDLKVFYDVRFNNVYEFEIIAGVDINSDNYTDFGIKYDKVCTFYSGLDNFTEMLMLFPLDENGSFILLLEEPVISSPVDVDGDSKPEFVIYNYNSTTLERTLKIYDAANMVIKSEVVVDLGLDHMTYRYMKIADVNGDSVHDIIYCYCYDYSGDSKPNSWRIIIYSIK